MLCGAAEYVSKWKNVKLFQLLYCNDHDGVISSKCIPAGVKKPRKLGNIKNLLLNSCVSRLFDELCSRLFEWKNGICCNDHEGVNPSKSRTCWCQKDSQARKYKELVIKYLRKQAFWRTLFAAFWMKNGICCNDHEGVNPSKSRTSRCQKASQARKYKELVIKYLRNQAFWRTLFAAFWMKKRHLLQRPWGRESFKKPHLPVSKSLASSEI